MAEKTSIEWTEATWNPWVGCTKISPGCARCYMFRDQMRWGRDPKLVRRTADQTFYAPIKWARLGLAPKVFTCSWSDWFHQDADEWRDEAWTIIRACPQITFQVLTKRPHLIADRLPSDWGENGYSNVWLGVSVENPRFTWRIDDLLQAPAAVRFVSAEPLLKRIDLTPWLRRVDWVIVGGESGPKARPMDLDWARDIRDQCQYAGIPFFLKQIGGFPDKRGGDKALLDGRLWREMA